MVKTASLSMTIKAALQILEKIASQFAKKTKLQVFEKTIKTVL